MDKRQETVEGLLMAWRGGDAAALEQLLPLVYTDLRRIARSILGTTPGHATLQTTALVHEVFLRLLGREPASFESDAHLLNACARMMRQILVDRARRAATEKRGGRWRRDEFVDLGRLPIPDGTEMLALDQAIGQLESEQPRMAQVVQLRYFVGLEVHEVAAALNVNPRTAERDWAAARAWLKDCIGA